MLSARVYERIGVIDPGRWDAIGDDPLSRHAVLAAAEAARMPGVRFRYAILETNGRAVAAVPLACVPIDAETLTHGAFRRAIASVRTAIPAFLRLRLCVCGTPLSIASPPLRIVTGVDPAPILARAGDLLRELAEEEGAAWRAFKEFGADAGDAMRALDALGWHVVPSEPTFVLPLRWRDLDGYLRDLRYPHRRRALLALSRTRGVISDIVPLKDYDREDHALYEQVLERAAIRFEHLTPEFFAALGRSCGDRARLLRFQRGRHLVGWVAILMDGRRAIDLFHGIDYRAGCAADLYVRQLVETVQHAAASGAGELWLGQSTEETKIRFGAETRPLWIGLRHACALVNALLGRFSPALFPERPVPVHRVFAERRTASDAERRTA